jgi:hypothetical protein
VQMDGAHDGIFASAADATGRRLRSVRLTRYDAVGYWADSRRGRNAFALLRDPPAVAGMPNVLVKFLPLLSETVNN